MTRTLLVTLAALSPLTAHAETRHADAHEHGRGALDIAIEGAALSLALRVPGADIVGFEHAAASDEDKAKIAAAQKLLADPLALFGPSPKAGCVVTEAKLSLAAEGEHEDHAVDHDTKGDHDHDHAHGDHDHDAKHGHSHADGHTHNSHDQNHGAEHNEFHAEYRLTCASPDHLDGFAPQYFDLFPNAQTLAVQLVSDHGATRVDLTRAAPRLSLESHSH